MFVTQPGPQMTFLISSRRRGYKNSKATGIAGARSEMRPVLGLELAPVGSSRVGTLTLQVRRGWGAIHSITAQPGRGWEPLFSPLPRLHGVMEHLGNPCFSSSSFLTDLPFWLEFQIIPKLQSTRKPSPSFEELHLLHEFWGDNETSR